MHCWGALCRHGIVLLGLRVRFPLGGCSWWWVAGLVTDGGEEVGIVQVEPGVRACASCLHDCIGVDWVSGPGGGGKRVRLSGKTPAHHVWMSFSGSQSLIRAWKRLTIPGSQAWEHVDAERRYVYQHASGAQPAHDSFGVG